MKNYIEKIKQKKNLTEQEMQEAMGAIMKGEVAKEDMASFLLALRDKGPTIEEITAAARAMRAFVLPVKTKHKLIFDACGTGGDKSGTFNISTIVALVVAASGVAVAKHGNRSISSRCGSADILEALGVKIDLDNVRLGQCLDEIGLAFLFAQKLHPAMKHAASVRKKLGVETIFNILGPLTNPAGATHQMVGVYDKRFVEPLANVLKNLGSKRVLVVHGKDGLDEITTTDETYASEFDGKSVRSYTISPEQFGIKRAKKVDLQGGDLQANVKITEEILSGQSGAKKDIVVLNAAHAFYIAENVKTVKEGLALADEIITSGRARQKLDQLKKFTQS